MLKTFFYLMIAVLSYFFVPDLWPLAIFTVFLWIMANESQFSEFRRARIHSNVYIDSNGYIASLDDKQPLHKDIIEHKIGRRMRANETVLYSDGNPFNISADNLTTKTLSDSKLKESKRARLMDDNDLDLELLRHFK